MEPVATVATMNAEAPTLGAVKYARVGQLRGVVALLTVNVRLVSIGLQAVVIHIVQLAQRGVARAIPLLIVMIVVAVMKNQEICVTKLAQAPSIQAVQAAILVLLTQVVMVPQHGHVTLAIIKVVQRVTAVRQVVRPVQAQALAQVVTLTILIQVGRVLL